MSTPKTATSPVRPGFLADRLVPLLLVAGAFGAIAPELGGQVGRYSLIWLGLLVFSVGLTLEPSEFAVAFRRPHLVALPVLLPWLMLLPAGIVLARFLPGTAASGLLTIASAPTEVSAVLLTAIAIGDVALATAAVSLSLLLSPLVIPLAFRLAAVPSAIEPADLLLELALGVAAPLLIALGLRAISRDRVRLAFGDYGPDVATLALTLLLIGAGAAARVAISDSALGPQDYAIAGAGILVALVLPLALGAGVAAGLGLPPRLRSAVTFTSGMREFGVATAVAQLSVPAAVAIPATYGVLLMLLSSGLARWLGRARARQAGQPQLDDAAPTLGSAAATSWIRPALSAEQGLAESLAAWSGRTLDGELAEVLGIATARARDRTFRLRRVARERGISDLVPSEDGAFTESATDLQRLQTLLSRGDRYAEVGQSRALDPALAELLGILRESERATRELLEEQRSRLEVEQRRRAVRVVDRASG
jgi:BASS family bile acid:Na+ symporter